MLQIKPVTMEQQPYSTCQHCAEHTEDYKYKEIKRGFFNVIYILCPYDRWETSGIIGILSQSQQLVLTEQQMFFSS